MAPPPLNRLIERSHMAVLETLTLPLTNGTKSTLVISRHDDGTMSFTDPEANTTKTCNVTLANCNALFLAIREGGIPRLSGISFS